jgi:hypothetical protein
MDAHGGAAALQGESSGPTCSETRRPVAHLRQHIILLSPTNRPKRMITFPSRPGTLAPRHEVKRGLRWVPCGRYPPQVKACDGESKAPRYGGQNGITRCARPFGAALRVLTRMVARPAPGSRDLRNRRHDRPTSAFQRLWNRIQEQAAARRIPGTRHSESPTTRPHLEPAFQDLLIAIQRE